MDCKFEVVITMPKGMPASSSALAERFIEAGCSVVAQQMKEAYGESLELSSIRLLEPPA
jgi:hypothetical protein